MEFKGIRRNQNDVEVYIEPSAEDGIFATNNVDTGMRLGKLAVLEGVRHVDACALELGDLTALDKYIQADPTRDGLFHLKTRGRLLSDNYPLVSGDILIEQGGETEPVKPDEPDKKA